MTKTRFAPSPTGYVHIGNLRSALYAYLYAKSTGGQFVLRIEDTDQSRKVEGAMENLINVLNEFGLVYDEGPYFENGKLKEKGDHGPYIQSERSELYKKYADQLVKEGKAYFCFCTQERLTEMRAKQEKLNKAPKYDKCCANLAKEEIDKKIKEGLPNVVRLKVTPGEVIEFEDLVRGKVQVSSNEIDDQVLLKSDGLPTYHLANVVDDHLMEITHVIRAEEWLPSTPKHLLIYRALGWKPPKFAHLPLVLNPDKSKLSKRHGSVSVEDFLKQGYLKEALLNFIAFLGWNPKDDREIMSLKELEKAFSLKGVNKSGAVFNLDKLNWINKQYLKNLSDDDFFALSKPFLSDYQEADQDILKKACLLEKERIEKLEDLSGEISFVFKLPDYDSSLLQWKKLSLKEVKKNLKIMQEFFTDIEAGEWSEKNLEQKTISFIKENNYQVGDMLWPTRVALSGKKNSPGPFEIAALLGKDETLSRFEAGVQK
ncbi:glutamate--tRNA ligase [Patescibacteria group bacterium]|nr:glutamate--tRNA ligase [Patescibacteria group bacterium]